ncbi:MntP/YtaF family protein [Paenibacillus septentrionalis]|uniref:MntP/YtaF family protein n=1 Tax=Paenibacillus septentrionalis TaxID=429342 RepID=A0ABW1V3M7_9BACL
MLFMHFASMAVLAIAVSLDSFGVGITYGLRKITIPLLSILIIACCSGGVIAISMQAGTWLSSYLSPVAASRIGAVILVAIGVWALYQYYRGMHERKNGKMESQETERQAARSNEGEAVPEQAEKESFASALFTIELKRLGLVIQILRKPQTADFDASGNISSSEALMLGIALSLDAFGAGLGAAMLGLHAIYTPLTIALCSAIFLVAGTMLGRKLSHLPFIHYLSGLPGLLLILLGFLKFM